MASRDDMVLVPTIEEVGVAAARVQAREDRILERMAGRKGAIRRLAKIHALRRARRKIQLIRAARTARGASGTLGAARNARFLANPVGLIVGALIVVGGVAGRLAAGRSFENIGANINNAILGALDEEARATIDTRSRFSSDPHLARIAGIEGVTPQMRSIFADLKRIREDELKGDAVFNESHDFDVQSRLDLLILKITEKVRQLWGSNGGDAELDRLRQALRTQPAGGR